MWPYNTETYYKWNEALAINHVDIRHQPERELNRVAFAEIYISSDPFDKIDISSLLHDIKSKCVFPMMVCVGHDWEGGGDGTQTFALLNGSFIILDRIDTKQPDKATARRNAYVKTERIAQEIVAWIKRYFELNVFNGHLVKMPVGEKIGPLQIDGPCYGTKVSYSYVSRYSSVQLDQDKFGDLVPEAETVGDEFY